MAGQSARRNVPFAPARPQWRFANLGSGARLGTATLDVVRVTQRLAELDAGVLRRLPWADTDAATVSLRLLVFYQAVALVDVFVGIGTGNGMVTGLAACPLVLGIGAAWRLLHHRGDRPPAA